jgi:hypothetical protein
MDVSTGTTAASAPVAYVNTGHPLRDWIAWKIANTQPGQPVFPVLHSALAQLIPMLLKMLTGQVSPLSK